MCVLIHTTRKDLLKKEELDTAMRNNSSGFFIAELLPRGKRNKLRTLCSQEAKKFWESIPDASEVVMHFRIPSRGGTTLDNVHGWEMDNILFSHNRTLYNLYPLMEEENWKGTDSEYFFKMIFIPLYHKYGGYKQAYRNGHFCPMLDHIIRSICGDFNKFMFVMPDNKVVKFGEWEGDDCSRPGFSASNMSYAEEVKEGFLQRIKGWFGK